MIFTPDQLRAARGLLDITQEDLHKESGVAKSSIIAFENGNSNIKEKSRGLIWSYLDHRGIEFTESDGVRKKNRNVINYEGKEGFASFRKDVLEEARKENADICISNCDERYFDKWGEGEVNDRYRNEMAEIRKHRPDFKFRTLARQNDTHFSAARHSEYRWVPEKEFGDFPFYIFGEKTAMLMFEEDNSNIFIINHPKITEFYRVQFNKMWDAAQKLDFVPEA